MKLVFTLEEVRGLIREHAKTMIEDLPENAAVRFIHKYSDGSGEAEVDDITHVDRIEVDCV